MSVYERPGAAYYATATKVTPHGAPCTENGIVGSAMKQKALDPEAGLVLAPSIAINERFVIRKLGEKEYPIPATLAAAVRGSGIYIRPSDNSLRLQGATAAGDLPFGRVTGMPGDAQGCGAGRIRIDTTEKDGLPLV